MFCQLVRRCAFLAERSYTSWQLTELPLLAAASKPGEWDMKGIDAETIHQWLAEQGTAAAAARKRRDQEIGFMKMSNLTFVVR